MKWIQKKYLTAKTPRNKDLPAPARTGKGAENERQNYFSMGPSINMVLPKSAAVGLPPILDRWLWSRGNGPEEKGPRVW
ncbi:hypothetical protein [Pontiella sp.]|uniref:hypothetical protein n=1 Tax=Pontiella sp. TaxID=2837462 RepID=UPI003567D9FC